MTAEYTMIFLSDSSVSELTHTVMTTVGYSSSKERVETEIEYDGGVVSATVTTADRSPFGDSQITASSIYLHNSGEIYESTSKQACLFGFMCDIAKKSDLYASFLYTGIEHLGKLTKKLEAGEPPSRLGYLNYFGPELSLQIGKQKLRTAPVYSFIEINGGFAIRPFENCHEFNYHKVQDIEEYTGLTYL